MDTDQLLRLLEPLLRLMIYGTMVCIVFAFLVRPLFQYLLLNKEIEAKKRLAAEARALEEARNKAMDSTDDDIDDIDDLTDIADDPVIGSAGAAPQDAAMDTASQTAAPGKQEMLSRLAESDPEKAGQLVKNWVNAE